MVRHIIPAANHHQFLIKVSLAEALGNRPVLLIGDSLSISGTQHSNDNRFWEFFVDSLQSNTRYNLQLLDDNDTSLADGWHLKTYPHPDSVANELTILSYTCAGGFPERVLNQEIFLTTEQKHLLLKKGLSFGPDVVIANGDHIYWDRKTMKRGLAKKLLQKRTDNIYGKLDLTKAMSSEPNFEVIKNIADAQIAELYGCLLRSTPSYFIPDDHDLLENDEAHSDLITLPPDQYGIDGHHTIQKLYYPEFLPDTNRPSKMSGQHLKRNWNYGTFRYGNLLETLLYDCKRYTSLDGKDAVLVAKDAEGWLINRTLQSNAKHMMHIPSSQIGLSAGKWSEWYPDVFQEDGTLGIGDNKKYKWQKGWWLQHQRILKAWLESGRTPVFLQGDLHISSYALIEQSGDLDFCNKPIHAIGTGTLGTGDFGFPGSFRGTSGQVPLDLVASSIVDPLEKNGFSILHITPEKIKIIMYAWRPIDGEAAIQNLEPILVKEILRSESL